MLRRARWFGAGAAIGIGASVWGQRKLKTAAARYRPARYLPARFGSSQRTPARPAQVRPGTAGPGSAQPGVPGPAGLAGTAIVKARTWPAEVRAAVQEGRTTMRQREAELRQGLERAAGP